ncbi:hypothetical protein L3Y34_005344 [Caenorhabditis briggsae]|uniref:Uncharacterized protein n=2 Tax=Caenorhabditis briggsae TaxID=6238 RepID=A0AAE9D603_CAEBR|nr:hypothetical protein L3Y34_005344 [Caenorhabditis briggsae]
MSTNKTNCPKTTRLKQAPPTFIPGCARCQKTHMSLWCSLTDLPMKTDHEIDEKEKMRPATVNRAREASDNFAVENNNRFDHRNRNAPAKRSGFRGSRPAGQKQYPSSGSPQKPPPQIRSFEAPPPSSHPWLRPLPQPRGNPNNRGDCTRRHGNATSSGFSSSSRHHQNVPPRGPMMLPRGDRREFPPNEQHMRELNRTLKRFSYGTEDMYQEVPLPAVPKAIPRVPKNKAYVFTKTTFYDGNGVEIGKKSISQIYDLLENHQMIMIDWDEDLKLL